MIHTARTIPKETLKLLVFDLDGTLIDSRADLTASINAMLKHFHRQPLPEDVIAGYIGNGASTLVRRSLDHAGDRLGEDGVVPAGDLPVAQFRKPADATFVDAGLEFFLDYYHHHKLDHTYVYPGVFEALRTIRDTHAGRTKMAVLSNKPEGPSRAICEALGLTAYMFEVYGGDSFETKKPDPEGLLTLMREAWVTAAETVMIGDTDVDILTASNAATWSIGCRFGLSPHTLETVVADSMVEEALEWLPLLL